MIIKIPYALRDMHTKLGVMRRERSLRQAFATLSHTVNSESLRDLNYRCSLEYLILNIAFWLLSRAVESKPWNPELK